MSGLDRFLVSVLNAILRGEFLDDLALENKLGFDEVNTATMKRDIKKGKINTDNDIKDRNSNLFIMITKSLAFLSIDQQVENEKISHYTKNSVEDLKKHLEKLWGKPITDNEYHNIMKQ